MAMVTFSAAGETLYAYLAGEIDHDAAQSDRVLGTSLRLQHAPAQLQKVLRLAGIPCTENIEKENAQ